MKPKVHILTTGGTIAMASTEAGADMTDAGTRTLASQLGVPNVEIIVTEIMRKGSINITLDDWKLMAEAVANAVKVGADGVVLLHGTDTMHYTASALTFMLRGLSVPLVITGSMIPGSDPGSDAVPNLRDAVTIAASADVAEVCIVFSADLERSKGIIIRGCRARKIHSYAINAFASINLPPIGYTENGKISYTKLQVTKRERKQLELRTKLEPNVVLIKQTPALTADRLARFLDGASGAVIEGTGIGHVRIEDGLLDVIASFNNPVVMASQAIYGGEHLGIYALDKSILDVKNIIPTRDMNSETALVKLMWCLGQGGDIRTMMLTNIAGELT